MTTPAHRTDTAIRAPVLWGLIVGIISVAAAPLFWWLELSTVHALSIAFIAAVYIGFAVADGRPKVLVAEVVVASLFVVGYAAHGGKDLWQHRTHFVTNTNWWPPFCCAVDWLVAAALAVMIAAGVSFH